MEGDRVKKDEFEKVNPPPPPCIVEKCTDVKKTEVEANCWIQHEEKRNLGVCEVPGFLWPSDQPLNFGQIRSNFGGSRHGSDRNVPPAVVALVPRPS